MSDLLESVARNNQAQGLFRKGEKLLVAVSGGVDSMVLLHILNQLAARLANKWKLAVAHLNHGLRGKSSDADERLVRAAARELRLPAVFERADVGQIARRRKISIEMAARALRHQFLAQAAARTGSRIVALAHHRDDQVELFFLRLFRGSGLDGLAGMKWKSSSPVNAKLILVRPMLDQSKAALKDFAQRHGIRAREDASNRSLDFLRNRIRHQLLPLLRRQFQPGLDKAVLRTMNILAGESEWAEITAEKVWREQPWLGRAKRTTSGNSFNKLHLSLQRRLLQKQLIALGIPPSFDLIEFLRENEGLSSTILRSDGAHPAISVCRDASGLLRLIESQPRPFEPGACELDISGPRGKTVFEGLEVSWKRSRGGRSTLEPMPGRESFDAGRVGRSVVLRHWQQGDRFQPIGMSSAVKLQDFFTNAKISAEKRRKLALATTRSGEIFWVEGMRISERFKLTSETTCCLNWRWRRVNSRVAAGL